MDNPNNQQNAIYDLEELSYRDERPPPHARRFRIRIDKQHFTVNVPEMTGLEILALVEKAPPRFKLVQRLRGGKTAVIRSDEMVDFRSPGIERFNTLPCDQTEGEASLRRDFSFSLDDTDFLESLELRWETLSEGNTRWLVIRGYMVPAGYTHRKVDVAIQVPPGYPDTPLDMAFFCPSLARKDGKSIKATTASAIIGGRSYQRWSRHRTAENAWRPGVDSLATHLHLVADWLQREFSK